MRINKTIIILKDNEKNNILICWKNQRKQKFIQNGKSWELEALNENIIQPEEIIKFLELNQVKNIYLHDWEQYEE